MASFFYLQILKVKKDISCLSKASAVCLGPLVIVAWSTWGRLFISEGCLYSSHFSGLKSILGMRPDLRCACSSSWDCTGENGFCLCWRVSMARSFLLRGGSLCPLPALSTGALSLSWTYAGPVRGTSILLVSGWCALPSLGGKKAAWAFALLPFLTTPVLSVWPLLM